MKKLLFALFVVTTIISFTSCRNKKEQDKAKQQVEKVKENVNDAVDKVSDKIEDGADAVKDAWKDTACESFRDQEECAVKNSADPCCGCETINIDCKAHNCTYNEHCKCTAASINVSGANAHRCCDTKCDTFSCEC